MKNKLVSVILSLLIIFVICIPMTSAHSFPQCNPGRELDGYLVDCNNHQSSSSFTWNTSIVNSPVAVDYAYRQATVSGASKWSGTVTITNTSTSSDNGKIYTYSDTNTSNYAVFHEYSSNSSGHLTKWKIKYNKYKMDSLSASDKAIIAAHELGHAIGLNDLGVFYNDDKLMYGYWPLKATSPTAEDKAGAKEATKP